MSTLQISHVFPKVIAILQRYNKSGGTVHISVQTDLSSDLNLDSLTVMDLIMDLEQEFNISIPMNVMSEIKTAGDLTSTIVKLASV
ncbi:MAG TPA: acyl carrier protein [Alphaproteobacteria bacterium]|nr:acyl carrier protein [Alphaproteobacteria bacterium]